MTAVVPTSSAVASAGAGRAPSIGRALPTAGEDAATSFEQNLQASNAAADVSQADAGASAPTTESSEHRTQGHDEQRAPVTEPRTADQSVTVKQTDHHSDDDETTDVVPASLSDSAPVTSAMAPNWQPAVLVSPASASQPTVDMSETIKQSGAASVLQPSVLAQDTTTSAATHISRLAVTNNDANASATAPSLAGFTMPSLPVNSTAGRDVNNRPVPLSLKGLAGLQITPTSATTVADVMPAQAPVAQTGAATPALMANGVVNNAGQTEAEALASWLLNQHQQGASLNHEQGLTMSNTALVGPITSATNSAAAMTPSAQWAPIHVAHNGNAATESSWQQQLVQSLGERLTVQVSQQLKQAHVRLDPPDLGRIDMTVRLDGDRLSVQLQASHPVVRDALTQQMDRLRADLTMQPGQNVNVSVSDHGQSGQHPQHGSAGHYEPATAVTPGIAANPLSEESSSATPTDTGWVSTLV